MLRPATPLARTLAGACRPQVGEASQVELQVTARLRLGVARLLLLDRPLLVLVDDADRFVNAVPRFAGACVGGKGCRCGV